MLVALGLMGLVTGTFTPVWQPVPPFPGREVLVWLSAVLSLACGVGLLVRRAAAQASRVLLVAFLAWLVLLRVPQMFIAFQVNTWFAAAETSVMTAAAWVLYVQLAGAADAPRLRFAAGDTGLTIARVLYGVPLIPFGIAHFLYLARTASLVPGWLPGHLFWAHFFGVTFIAAGVGVTIGVYARLAAALSTLQMGMFTVLVWVPIVVAGTPKPSDWTEFIASAALTAAGWVVTDSWQGTAWFAARGRSAEA